MVEQLVLGGVCEYIRRPNRERPAAIRAVSLPRACLFFFSFCFTFARPRLSVHFFFLDLLSFRSAIWDLALNVLKDGSMAGEAICSDEY